MLDWRTVEVASTFCGDGDYVSAIGKDGLVTNTQDNIIEAEKPHSYFSNFERVYTIKGDSFLVGGNTISVSSTLIESYKEDIEILNKRIRECNEDIERRKEREKLDAAVQADLYKQRDELKEHNDEIVNELNERIEELEEKWDSATMRAEDAEAECGQYERVNEEQEDIIRACKPFVEDVHRMCPGADTDALLQKISTYLLRG